MSTAIMPPQPQNTRIFIFVDFFNLSLSLKERHGGPFMTDWTKLRIWLVEEAARVAGINDAAYRGMSVYAAYGISAKDIKLKQWMNGWLDSQPGVQVNLRPRKKKRPPKCPSCYETVEHCPACKASFDRTEEKGVDTAIATDMIRLAWERRIRYRCSGELGRGLHPCRRISRPEGEEGDPGWLSTKRKAPSDYVLGEL